MALQLSINLSYKEKNKQSIIQNFKLSINVFSNNNNYNTAFEKN